MSLTKEIIEQESQFKSDDERRVLHLHSEGTFLRAYDWSAWLACRFLHDFKVNKRTFKGIEQPVVYIGFPETSLEKWIPEGAEQSVVSEKHLAVYLPEQLFTDETSEKMEKSYAEWKEAIPLTEPQKKKDKKQQSEREDGYDGGHGGHATLTAVMQSILAYPIESKSPLESMVFLAGVKRRFKERSSWERT